MNEKREMKSVEIVSRAYNLCVNNWSSILKVALIFIIPASIISIIFSNIFINKGLEELLYNEFLIMDSSYYTGLSYYSEEEYIFRLLYEVLKLSLFASIVSIIMSIFIWFGGLVISKILGDANQNKEVNWIEAIKYIWSKKWGLIGLNLLTNVAIALIYVVVLVAIVVTGIITLGIALIMTIPSLIVIMFVLMPIMNYLNSMYIINNVKIGEAIGKVLSLFKGRYFGQTVAVSSTISAIMLAIGLASGIFALIPIVGYASTIVLQVIAIVFTYACSIVFIFDRTKSFDEGTFLGDN
ncbi:MAG: hypothetical protein IJO26_03770 [Clostridium sp.]|nr:hypothetical protein [Clostridium sp.]